MGVEGELGVRLSDVTFCDCTYDYTLSPGACKADGCLRAIGCEFGLCGWLSRVV